MSCCARSWAVKWRHCRSRCWNRSTPLTANYRHRESCRHITLVIIWSTIRALLEESPEAMKQSGPEGWWRIPGQEQTSLHNSSCQSCCHRRTFGVMMRRRICSQSMVPDCMENLAVEPYKAMVLVKGVLVQTNQWKGMASQVKLRQRAKQAPHSTRICKCAWLLLRYSSCTWSSCMWNPTVSTRTCGRHCATQSKQTTLCTPQHGPQYKRLNFIRYYCSSQCA